MFEAHSGNTRAGLLRPVAAVAVLLLVLVMPAQVLAQQAGDPSFNPRFAVGGGFQLGTVVCIECDDPGKGGASVGFEVRLTDDWSLVSEGIWTAGYDVYDFDQGGVTYPGMTHDYFALLDVKFRWEFSGWRHRPYLVIGGAVRWDHDTSYNYQGQVVDGRWTRNVNDVEIREEIDTRGALVAGFGWSFKVSDRIEIRPEADLYIGPASFARVGVTGWFNF